MAGPAVNGGQSPTGRLHSLPVGETVIGLIIVALAGLVFWQASGITTTMYTRVGPRVIPYIAAAGLLLTGLALLWQAWRGGWQDEEEKNTRPDGVALGWVLAGLALNVVLISHLGFTLASVVMFVCVARGFGSRRILRDVVLALIFALIAYFGFAKTLGINIGAGLLENLIEAPFR